MKQWSYCPYCSGDLDTGWECNDCGADWMPVAYLWSDRLLDWLRRMIPVGDERVLARTQAGVI